MRTLVFRRARVAFVRREVGREVRREVRRIFTSARSSVMV